MGWWWILNRGLLLSNAGRVPIPGKGEERGNNEKEKGCTRSLQVQSGLIVKVGPGLEIQQKQTNKKKQPKKSRIFFFFPPRETSPSVQEMSATFHLHMAQLENMDMECVFCQALEMNLHQPHNPQNGSPGIFEFHFV